jgi:hypothetical protein
MFRRGLEVPEFFRELASGPEETALDRSIRHFEGIGGPV